MISLRDQIVNENILTSTKYGISGLKEKVEKWIDDNNIEGAVINPDCSITVKGIQIDRNGIDRNVVKGPIPDYIVINEIGHLTVTETDSLKNLPKRSVTLKITDSTIKDFKEVDIDVCKMFGVSNCDIKSLAGLPECDMLYLGNNKQHFSKKEVKKFANTNPNKIHTLGYYNPSFYHTLLGKNDADYCRGELVELEKLYLKSIPELDHMKFKGAREDNSVIYFTLDFLPESKHYNGIAENSIYLTFEYDVEEGSLEYRNCGHLELTEKDKVGKYKYYALKRFTAPYDDAGGKKFRKTRLDDFTAQTIYLKTIDWIKAVVAAAIEDQGGVLERK